MTTPATGSGQARKVVAASLLGNTIEYYEFFIYGLCASLIFNKLFFPSFDPVVGTLLSLTTFAIAFVARPIGGWVAGHFGDRLGRRAMLVLTLSGMGLATTLIGLLPTYDTIGVAAPIMLTVLRFLQGFSLGGEASGGFLMALEHASGSKRGLVTGVVGTGNVCGLLLANGVFLAVSQLPEDQLMSWGWRIPFLLSAVLVAIGLYIRLHLEESPVFQAAQASGVVSESPSKELFRGHWKQVIGVALANMPTNVIFYLGSVFALSYASAVGANRSTVLAVVMATAAILIVAMPYFGSLGDRIDRKKILLAGIALMAVAPFLFFPLIATGNPWLMLIGFLVLFSGFAANYGALNAFLPHQFPARLRYSGVAIGTNVGGVFGGALAPIIATALLGRFHSWVPIALYLLVIMVAAAVATAALSERPDALDDAADSGTVAEEPRIAAPAQVAGA
ncbi:MFS transporter [Mycolicibacterium setense]